MIVKVIVNKRRKRIKEILLIVVIMEIYQEKKEMVWREYK